MQCERPSSSCPPSLPEIEMRSWKLLHGMRALLQCLEFAFNDEAVPLFWVVCAVVDLSKACGVNFIVLVMCQSPCHNFCVPLSNVSIRVSTCYLPGEPAASFVCMLQSLWACDGGMRRGLQRLVRACSRQGRLWFMADHVCYM